MNSRKNSKAIKSFNFEGKGQTVFFVETVNVANGVKCDVYKFDDDPKKDLGIIRIAPGKKTPLQKVLKGDKTIEGYISGKGKLTITKPNGKKIIYHVGENTQQSLNVIVEIGELMQWQADKNSKLIAYEICYPPYKNGRYENIE
jgi:hypothetical protein